MKKNFSNCNNIFWIAPNIALIVEIFPIFYSYYVFTRLVISGCALYYAIKSYKNNDKVNLWIFGFIFFFYSPTLPDTLSSKEMWMIINMLTIVYFYINGKKLNL